MAECSCHSLHFSTQNAVWISQFCSSVQHQNRTNNGREHTVIFSHRGTLSVAKPLSWPPARKSNNLQKFYYLCASRAIWPLQGKSFSIIHPILHVSSVIHSINIDWAPTGKLAERQCLLLNKQERGSRDPSDSISMLQWRNPEKEYSLWCPLSYDEAHCAGRVTIPGLASRV